MKLPEQIDPNDPNYSTCAKMQHSPLLPPAYSDVSVEAKKRPSPRYRTLDDLFKTPEQKEAYRRHLVRINKRTYIGLLIGYIIMSAMLLFTYIQNNDGVESVEDRAHDILANHPLIGMSKPILIDSPRHDSSYTNVSL